MKKKLLTSYSHFPSQTPHTHILFDKLCNQFFFLRAFRYFDPKETSDSIIFRPPFVSNEKYLCKIQ